MVPKKILIFLITFSYYLSFSQINNNIQIKIGYPIPNSKIQFSEYYHGILSGEIDYSRKLSKYYLMGLGLQFNYFTFKQFRDFPFSTSIYYPNLYFGYSLNIRKVQLEPLISLGYSFFNHYNHGRDTIFWYKNIEISPGINILFLNHEKLKFGFSIGYSIIFESFYGKDSLPVNVNGDMDDKTTRYFTFNIIVSKCY